MVDREITRTKTVLTNTSFEKKTKLWETSIRCNLSLRIYSLVFCSNSVHPSKSPTLLSETLVVSSVEIFKLREPSMENSNHTIVKWNGSSVLLFKVRTPSSSARYQTMQQTLAQLKLIENVLESFPTEPPRVLRLITEFPENDSERNRLRRNNALPRAS